MTDDEKARELHATRQKALPEILKGIVMLTAGGVCAAFLGFIPWSYVVLGFLGLMVLFIAMAVTTT